MCVLLVEDEELIRMIMRENLEEAGFEVFDVASADEAIEAIEDSSRSFSVLVTDLHLAGRSDGLAVARSMRATHPETPVILATGRPDVLGNAAVDTPFVLLAKPYRGCDLIATIDRVRS